MDSDLKSAPQLLCDPESIQTHSGSLTCYVSNNDSESMRVGGEVDEMFPKDLSRFTMLQFYDYDLQSFLKTSSPVSVPDFLCALESATETLWIYFHIWNIRRLGRRVSNIQ